MATVSEWTPFEVALDLTATAGTVTRISETQYTVKINASWEAHWEGAQTNYGMTASSGGGSVNLNESGTKASSGSGSFTGTYSISGNGSATKTITVTFKNYLEDWQGNIEESATKAVTFNVNVPAWTSYTISYNANGGSGAPSSQTKWKDENLTLSSVKPTRTGFTFQFWQEQNTGTKYNPSQTYTKNESANLVAVWSENVFTVNFYSNYADYCTYEGESINVSSSSNVKVYTKEYLYNNEYPDGLSNVQNEEYLYMTRTGYTPTGYWGTSTTGGTLVSETKSFTSGQAVAEAFGKSIKTGNASINIYAQWEANILSIKYNANGGTIDSDAYCVDDGFVCSMSDVAYTVYTHTTTEELYGVIGDRNQCYKTDLDGTICYLEFINGLPIGETIMIKKNSNGIFISDDCDIYFSQPSGYNVKGTLSFNKTLNYLSPKVLIDNWTYNNAKENGLYNASTFGLTRLGYDFVGWKLEKANILVHTCVLDSTVMEESDDTSRPDSNRPWCYKAILNNATYFVRFNGTYESGSTITIEEVDGVFSSKQCLISTTTEVTNQLQGYVLNFTTEEKTNIVIYDQNDTSLVPTDFTNDIKNGDCSITLYAVWKLSGVVYIDNSIELEKYLVYIDNGTEWDLYLPYIDNGTGWDVIS